MILKSGFFLINKGQQRQQGYTLIELMLALTISLIALGILGRAFVSQKKIFDEQRQIVEMQQNAKIAMHLMVSEFSCAGYIPEGGTAAGGTENQPTGDSIKEMDATVIIFAGDIDGDNKTEKIRYALSGSELTRQVWEWTQGTPDSWVDSGGGAQSVISDVEALTITYMAESESSALTVSTVRKINIQMQVAAKKGDGTAFRTQTLSSGALARNLDL